MIKLLLVEDDPTFSYIVKSGLQEIIGGYEVMWSGVLKSGSPTLRLITSTP